MDIKKFIYAVTGTFGAGIGIHLLSFVTTIVIVHNLSTRDYGVFSLIMSFSTTLTYMSVVGLPQVIIFFLGKRKEPPERVIGLSLFLTGCIGILTVILGCILKGPVLRSFLKDIPSFYYYLLLIYFFITLVDTCLLSIYRGFQNYLIYNIRRLLNPLGNLLGIGLLFLFFKISLETVVAAFITINIVTTTWLFLRLISRTPVRFYFNWNLLKSFFGYGIKSYSQLLIGHLIYQIDIYIISYLLGVKEVAYYSIAVGVATMLWFIPDTVGTVLFPTLSSTQKEEEIHAFSAKICRNILFVTTIGAISLGIAGKYFILLFYGSSYSLSITPMWLILPGIVAMSGYKILTRDFSSRDRQQVPIVAGILSLIVNVCLNFLWIPKYGIEGASLASTVAYFLAGAILVITVKAESDIPLRKIIFIDRSDIKHLISLANMFNRKSSVSVLNSNEDTVFSK